jgi:hypothetical protein
MSTSKLTYPPRRPRLTKAVLGVAVLCVFALPASAVASSGSIEGVTAEPALAHASVQNLSVAYDGCSAAGNPTCSWEAHAWLVAPPRTACPSNGSELMLALENPPGLPPPPPSEQPWLGTRQVWRLASTGDGSLQSGPLQLNLEGVNDQHLCLYATEPPAVSTYTLSRAPQPAYIAGPERAPLLASQLLHVDPSPQAPSILLPDVEISASGETVPAALPRSRLVPIALRLGFTSEVPSTHTAPELTRIALNISRDVTLQAAGLPSCPIAKLYSSAADARQACAGSLLGRGAVNSEVTLPGQPTATIHGRLLAFYGFAEGQPRILAQVTSGAPLPLTYVIPFQIEKAHGPFGTSLVVHKMSQLQGECERTYPNCFAQPYSLKGVYGHISMLELSLKRRFVHAGKWESFLSADCPAGGHQSVANSQFGVSLRYNSGSSLGDESATVLRRCKVSN